MFKYIIIIFFNLSIVLSQNIDELFEDGNRFYKYNTKGFSELFDTNCKNAK